MKKPDIFESFGLKLLAVFISIMLWLVVINVSDPVSSNTYSGVGIQAINTEAITSQGKVYEIEGDAEVTITVNAKRSVLDSLGNENFRAIVDLADYDAKTQTAPLRVESNKHSDAIESIKTKTDTVQIIVEDMLRKQFVIVPVVSGEPEEGYVIGDVTTAENIVRISGAQSVVSTIKKVTAEVNVSGLSSSITTSVDLKLYNEEDELIKDANLIKNISTVAISAQLLATKEIGIRVAGANGVPAEGFCIASQPAADTDSIIVAGKSNLLSGINELEIPSYAVNVEGLDRDAQVEIDITKYLPEGISLPQGQEKMVVVTVPIEVRQIKQVEIDSKKVVISNVPDGYQAEIVMPEKITLELNGSAADLEEITEENVKLGIDWEAYTKQQDMDAKKEATYRVPLQVTLDKSNTVLLSRDVLVTLKLSEKKAE